MNPHGDSFSPDVNLLRRIKNGDPKAFEILFNRYWEMLYRSAFGVLNNSSAAEDIVQEVFTALWKRRNTLDIQNVSAYLHGAVKNQVAKNIKQMIATREHVKRIQQTQETNETEELIYSSDLSRKIDQGIAQLPEKCRQVFLLSRNDQLTNQQIAEKLDLSVRTVETHILVALRKLKKYLYDTERVMIN